MTTAWIALDSPAIPNLLRRAFDLDLPPHAGSISLDELSRIARHNGCTMNVRTAELPLDDHSLQPHLIVRDGRFLTVLSRGSSWLLLDADGRFLRVDAREMLRFMSTDGEKRQIDTYHALMQCAGVSGQFADALIRSFGLARGSELAQWMVDHRDAIHDGDGFVRLALDAPDLLPMSWSRQTVSPQVKEISFDRHLQLRGPRTLGNAARDLVSSESSLLFSLLGIILVGIPIGYLLPLCIAFLIDRAREVGDVPALVFAVLIIALVLSAHVDAVRSLGFVRLGARVRIRLLNAFLFRLLGSRIQNLRTLTDGDMSVRLSDLSVAQQLLFGQTLPSLMSTLMLAGGMIYLGSVAPVFLVPLGIAALLTGILYALIAPRLRELTRERLVTYSSWRDRLIERFEHWKLFQHFDPEHGMLPRIDPYLSATADLGQRGSALAASLTLGTAVVALGFLGAAGTIGVRDYQREAISLGQFLVLMGLSLATFRGSVGVASLVAAWVRAEPSIRRLRELVEHTEPEPLTNTMSLSRDAVMFGSGLTIRDVSFAWPKRAPVVSQLSLEVAPAEWIAIVGRSGSGKSTLAYLLGGLIEPTAGTIAVGGDANASLDEIRRHIAVVPQEPVLFDVTLRENIAAGLDSVSDESLQRAVHTSDLTNFAAKRRRGLDDFVGENGTQVSVGEKARIALARALVRAPRILVLDETFGHLDEATANRVVDNLRRERLAVILLTHDEKLAQRCDRVYSLRDGVLNSTPGE